MKRPEAICFLLSLILFGTVPVSALEFDYYTYSGITQVSNAFRYIALFFSHEDYEDLMFLTASLGLVVAAIVGTSENSPKDKTMKNWAVMFTAGVAIYSSFVIPKGTIHVYDPTLNRNESIAGVPDGIVLIAGLTNLVEQIAVDIANASSPTPYENTAGGIVFELMQSTYNGQDIVEDEYLWQNIKNYYVECGQVAAAIGGSGFDANTLNRTSTDLLATFANAQSAVIEIPYMTQANPLGNMTTCTDAYTLIQNDLNDPNTYTSILTAMCGSVGYDTAQAAQRTQCYGLVDEILPTIFAQAGDRITYLRSAALAMAMQEAAADQNPERAIAQEANRNFGTQSLGLLGFAKEYGQSIRAGFLAAALSTLPITLLFLMTPMRLKALSISFGFFVFVALWGMIDIGLQVMLESMAIDAFEEVRRNNLAFDAFMLAPPASVKALNVFGASRLISITLASTIVVTVFRLSGASFGQLTNSIAHRGEQIGGDAAETRLNPTNFAQETEARASAAGTLAAMGATGSGTFGKLSEMHEGRWLQDLSKHDAFAGAASRRGYGGSEFYQFAGAVQGGREAGQLEGVARQSTYDESALAGTSLAEGATSSERGVLDAAAYEEQASNLASQANIPLQSAKELLAGYDHAVSTGRISGANGKLDEVFATARTEEQQRMGTAAGAREGASRLEMSPGQISKAESFLNTLFAGGDARFAEGATAKEMDGLTMAGEIKRERLSGEMEGLETAAAYVGQDAAQLSRDTAAIDAADRVLGRHRMSEFADQHGISTSDILMAQGSNMELAVNDRTLNAFAEHMTPGQLDIARPGSTMSFSFDPSTNEIGRMDVRSGFSGTSDNTTNIQDGYRVDAQQGTEGGITLFRYADMSENGNVQGAAQLNRLIETSQGEGSLQTLQDGFAQQTSNTLSNIAGKQVTYLSSDSETGSAEVFAGAKISGGFKVFGAGVEGEAGGKTSHVWSDVDSAQVVNSYDYWNDQLRDVWDSTIGYAQFEGDNIDRAQAFLAGVNDLRDRAFELQDWVKNQDIDDAAQGVTDSKSSPGATPDGEVPKEPDFDWSQYTGFRRY